MVLLVSIVFDDGLSHGMDILGSRSGPEGSSLNLYAPCSWGRKPEKLSGLNQQNYVDSIEGVPQIFFLRKGII